MPLTWFDFSENEWYGFTEDQWHGFYADAIQFQNNLAVVYRENDDDSYAFATYYADYHNIDYSNLLAVPCSDNEILSSYAQFQTEVENPLKLLLTNDKTIIVVGYNVPGGFIDGDDTISTTSRLSRINHSYTKGMLNPLFARTRFKRYDAEDATTALIVSRIDAPSLDDAKAIVDNIKVVTKQNKVNGKFFFDPYVALEDDSEEDYYNQLLDFEAVTLPLLNLTVYKTTFWDEYTDVVIPRLKDDSFMWAWKADRAGFTFFKERTTARVFLYNADTDGGASVRDVTDKRWPMLALNAGYAATAGAMSDPLPDGFLRPKPFFDALFRSATIGEAFLFSVPNFDWTVSLFGDPLVRVKFPTTEVILSGFTSTSGFEVMGRNLQSAIAYSIEREAKYTSAYTAIHALHDVDTSVELLPIFAELANGVIAKTKPDFDRLVNQYTLFPRDAENFSKFLDLRGLRISRLLPIISSTLQVPSNLLYPKGYWKLEDTIQQLTTAFATYHFQLQLANDVDFTDLIDTGTSYVATDTAVVNADSNSSTIGWFYEKETNEFRNIPASGVISSYAGRRVRYAASESEYFAVRRVYYARIRQINEFGEYTDWREYKQVVGT